MLKGALQGAFAFTAAIAVAYPLTREMSDRGAVAHQLTSTLDDSDAAALRHWDGTTHAFVAMLRARCARDHGAAAPACDRYRSLAD